VIDGSVIANICRTKRNFWVMRLNRQLFNETKDWILVEVGIATLLWTFIALMNSLEDVFYQIWNIRYSRTIRKKIRVKKTSDVGF
jgi:uncharacterized BrkB/YihY/UPF0761 family membrane protein